MQTSKSRPLPIAATALACAAAVVSIPVRASESRIYAGSMCTSKVPLTVNNWGGIANLTNVGTLVTVSCPIPVPAATIKSIKVTVRYSLAYNGPVLTGGAADKFSCGIGTRDPATRSAAYATKLIVDTTAKTLSGTVAGSGTVTLSSGIREQNALTCTLPNSGAFVIPGKTGISRTFYIESYRVDITT